MAVNIVAQGEEVLAGAFMARAAYGGEYIAPAFDLPGDSDSELADDYRGYLAAQGFDLLSDAELATFDDRGGDATFTAGGLYNARVVFGDEDSFDAQGLLAVRGDTLALSFRGTDGKDPAVLDAQTFSGASLAANYKAFRPLIDAAHDYVAAHGGIQRIVVSGQSLGGALADVFALADAARFRELRPGGLTIVSVASSGVPPDLPLHLDGLDEDAIEFATVTIGGVEIELPAIADLVAPGDYISIANSEDRARFAKNFPDIPEAVGLVPIVTLKPNVHFGADTAFDNPNIDNTDAEFRDPSTHPLSFHGIGAEHNMGLIWTNLQGLLADPLRFFYGHHKLTFGLAGYNRVADFDGTPIALFEGYLFRDDPRNDWDRGAHALVGAGGADYMLGLTGSDRIDGAGGNDLLSGGRGGDTLVGGSGSDRLHGGAEADTLIGGIGTDRLTGGSGGDGFIFRTLSSSPAGAARDVIGDFRQTQGDRIDVSAIADFAFIGTAAFSGAAAELRYFADGGRTIVQADSDGNGTADLEIALAGSFALTLVDFVL